MPAPPTRTDEHLQQVLRANIGTRIPRPVVAGLLAVCLLPFLLTLLGVDFGSHEAPLDHAWTQTAPAHEVVDAQFRALSGAFSHTLLEWTAVCLALCVAFLSFSHYRITGDITTPIIGMAFFAAGCMDAFHTLAADRLITAVADNRDLIPFTWAASRLFNALILIVGVAILLFRKREGAPRPGLGFVLGISAVFALAAFAIIQASATSAHLPQTTFPDAVISRPFDALPLLLFAFAGLFIFPRLYRRAPSLFTHGLVLSAIPEVVTQAHMTFGSTALFDSHFNIAHFMKIIAYSVPLIGLTLDYTRTHKILKREILEREAAQEALVASETKQRAMIDTMVDAAIIINDRGIVQSVNPATEHMFGYSASELVGHNINMLMPEPYRSEHDGYLQRHLESGQGHVLGNLREVEARRRDGTVFPIELAITDMHIRGQRLFSGIVRDITERKKMSRLKDEFIATISHELRTPLTAIRGSLGLLTGGAAGELPQQAQTLLDLAHSNSERLLLLVNDLLDMEKIASGRLEFHFDVLAIDPFIDQALSGNAAFAEQCGVRLSVSQRLPTAHVRGDRVRLRQVMDNLISNACKFSPRDGIVDIAVSEHDDRIRISVSDFGPGIPEEFRPKLFEKFTQADASDSRQVGGIGLGLCISKAIVEKHDGEIGFSTEIDHGSTFHVDLPKVAPSPT